MFGLQKTGETPVTEFLRGRALGAFGMVEASLAQDFIVGSQPTIAEMLHGRLSLFRRNRQRSASEHQSVGSAESPRCRAGLILTT